MALKQDQRAMLQLVLERGQSYEDIASLLDLDTGAVRQRARAALTELGGSDPDADVALTDYLLGQADPIGRAEVVRHLKQAPESRALAEELVAKLQVIAPGADLPELPGATRRARPRPKPDGEEAPAGASWLPGFGGSLTVRQKQGLVGLLIAALAVVIVVLAVTGGFGSGGGGKTASTPTTARSETGVRIALAPQGGGRGGGLADVTKANGQPVILVAARGLEKPAPGHLYLLWVLTSAAKGYPLGFVRTSKSGAAAAQTPIPAPIARLRIRFIDVALVSRSEIKQIAKLASNASGGNLPAVPFTGKTVLRGDVQKAVPIPAGSNAPSGGSGTTTQGQG